LVKIKQNILSSTAELSLDLASIRFRENQDHRPVTPAL
jgi:hypothetical protein